MEDLYDGNGVRVAKTGPGGTKVYVTDVLGRMVAEYGGIGTSTCATCYLVTDYLGTARLVTDQNANVIARHDYLPFGEEIGSGLGGRTAAWGPGLDTISLKFTGQVRDSETGEDFFNARYFTAAMGRFNSPDPANAGADLMNPQSWNGYGYVLGNPLALVDPSGMSTVNPVQTGGSCTDICFSTEVFGSPLVSSSFTGLGGGGGSYRTQYYGIDPLFTDVTFGKQFTPTVDVPLLNSLVFPAKTGTLTQTAVTMRCAADKANSVSAAALLPQNASPFLRIFYQMISQRFPT